MFSNIDCGGDVKLADAMPSYREFWRPSRVDNVSLTVSEVSFEDAVSTLLEGSNPDDVEGSGSSNWCGSIGKMRKICIGQSGKIYKLKFVGSDSSSYDLNNYSTSDLPTDGRLKMGFQGEFFSPQRAKSSQFPIYFRIGIHEDLEKGPKNAKFELDIESVGGVWREVARGELVKSNSN
ncbi:MAG: hypothetical protein NT027_03875 [Proteobacteria bacterium]|nr:hypothetical protein [Pseudomonadota bacterium]